MLSHRLQRAIAHDNSAVYASSSKPEGRPAIANVATRWRYVVRTCNIQPAAFQVTASAFTLSINLRPAR